MRSLRVKIAVAMAVLGFVATAMVGVVSYRSTSTRLVDEVDRSMKEATSLLVNIRSGDDLVVLPGRGLLGVYSVRLLDRTAEVVNSSFKKNLELTAKAKLATGDDKGFDVATITFEGERFRVHTVGAATVDARSHPIAAAISDTRITKNVVRCRKSESTRSVSPSDRAT